VAEPTLILTRRKGRKNEKEEGTNDSEGLGIYYLYYQRMTTLAQVVIKVAEGGACSLDLLKGISPSFFA